jgi:proton glutamate symport protein
MKLHWQILIAFILAVLFGYFIPQGVQYVSWIGDIFLRALKMVIIPLVFSSIISGVTSMGDGKNLGRLGIKTMFYYLATSTLAILTGLLLVNLVKPGVGVDLGFSKTVEGLTEHVGSVKDIFYRLIPENIIDVMARGEILPVIFFAILFGFFITKVPDNYRQTLTGFFDAFFQVMMKVTLFIIKFTPLGIFGIVSAEVKRNAGELASIAGSLAIIQSNCCNCPVVSCPCIAPAYCAVYWQSQTLCTPEKYDSSAAYCLFNFIFKCHIAAYHAGAGKQQRSFQ